MAALLPFAAGLMAALGVLLVFLAQARLGRAAAEAEAARAAPLAPRTLRERVSASAERVVHTVTPPTRLARMAEDLSRASIRLRVSEYIGLRILLALLLGGLGYLRFGLGIQAILLAVAGAVGPVLYVRYQKGRRIQRLNDQLADTITLLSNGLKAGYAFPQSMESVAKGGRPPISEEFARAVRELALGGSVEDALRHLSARVGSRDLDLVVTAVLIQHKVGGDLSEVLDRIAHTIRERAKVQRELRTATATARASGWLITALPLVLSGFLYLITPTYFRPMTESAIGWFMLGMAGFLILMGNLLMRRMAAVKF